MSIFVKGILYTNDEFSPQINKLHMISFITVIWKTWATVKDKYGVSNVSGGTLRPWWWTCWHFLVGIFHEESWGDRMKEPMGWLTPLESTVHKALSSAIHCPRVKQGANSPQVSRVIALKESVVDWRDLSFSFVLYGIIHPEMLIVNNDELKQIWVSQHNLDLNVHLLLVVFLWLLVTMLFWWWIFFFLSKIFFRHESFVTKNS